MSTRPCSLGILVAPIFSVLLNLIEGGVAIITKSFARIHETNLKKQGLSSVSLELTLRQECSRSRLPTPLTTTKSRTQLS